MENPEIPYTNQEIEDAAEFVGIEPKVLQVAIMVIYQDRKFRQTLVGAKK
jgi:hypothetical protein